MAENEISTHPPVGAGHDGDDTHPDTLIQVRLVSQKAIDQAGLAAHRCEICRLAEIH